MGGALDTAATEARYFDLALVPWAAGTATSQDMAQALVFGSGLPVILVPAAAPDGPLDHVAVAWDESRVAARALGDALRLVAPGGRVSVLTVHDEKPSAAAGCPRRWPRRCAGAAMRPPRLTCRCRASRSAPRCKTGPWPPAHGYWRWAGSGHSRLREFILGSATKGVLSDLRLPVLLAH